MEAPIQGPGGIQNMIMKNATNSITNRYRVLDNVVDGLLMNPAYTRLSLEVSLNQQGGSNTG